MEYSYVNPEWKEKQKQAKKKSSPKVGLAVLLSMVMMATVVGLFGGVLLANNYLTSRNEVNAKLNESVSSAATIVSATNAVSDTTSESTPTVVSTAESATRFAYSGLYTRAEICEIASPSVVGIDTVSTVRYWGGTYSAPGSGSGVILTSDGYIATCAHVVEDATEIQVTLNDDRVFPATLIGSDSRNDIAIIKIDAEGLVAAEIGDSDMLTVGEEVIAIGNPLGELRGSATAGIISALRRTVSIDSVLMELIQTDAAISPGNSGGGLFNAEGKLIGIVNAKANSDSAEGLGFAIPVNSVLDEINDLLQYGYVTGKAELGVTTQNVSLRSSYGFWSSGYGTSCVQVSSVSEGSAADKAGIQVGDLILAIDGTQVTSNSVLSDLVRSYDAGETATLTVQRNGQQYAVSVTFGEYIPNK
ncbi:MAG: trypsin-like peptidase domain-containing protein [Clostridia bacterium]|nr:trypsin-like peptidase domain-containing protein [Clostridia bacterium]